MPKKKEKKESSLNPEISRELQKRQSAVRRAKRAGWPTEESSFEKTQRARIKNMHLKILKDEHYDKHKKANRKIGGVRGKFHPSLERTRKKT